MAIKFRNRYLICSLHLKDGSPALLKSVSRQTILNALFSSLQSLCGDVGVGRAKASVTIKDMHVIPGSAVSMRVAGNGQVAATTQDHIVILLRTDRAMLREVWLAVTCVTEIDMRVARISVEDVGGGLARVKDRWLERLGEVGEVDEQVRARVAGLET